MADIQAEPTVLIDLLQVFFNGLKSVVTILVEAMPLILSLKWLVLMWRLISLLPSLQ